MSNLEVNVETKICSKCNESKIISLFKRNGKSGRVCKVCSNKITAIWREKNYERYLELSRQSCERHKIKLALKDKHRRSNWTEERIELEKKKNKDYALANKEKIKQRNKEYNLKKKYGLSWDDYQSMISNQDGKCAICDKVLNTIIKGNRFVVDHCHNTGVIRGILCDMCNLGIGYFSDKTELLQIAINYLNKNKEIK